MTDRLLSLLLIVAVWCVGELSSASELRFMHFSSRDGLSENTGTSLAQDHQGFIWIGTQDGLNRFDGVQFKVFRSDPDLPYALSEDYITRLYVDSRGLLWIGTFSGGLNRYDPKTGAFDTLRDGSALAASRIRAIMEDEDGAILFAAAGLGVFRIAKPAATAWWRTASKPMADALGNNVTALAHSRRGELWVGSADRGVQVLAVDGTITEVRASNYPEGPQSDHVTTLLIDRLDNIWIGTHASGLSRRDATGRWDHFAVGGERHAIANNSIHDIYEDRDGHIWVASSGGLDRIGPDLSVHHYQSRPGNAFALPYDTVYSVMQDRSGSLWVGTAGGGISRHNSGNERFRIHDQLADDLTSFGNNPAWSFAELDRTLWIGTGDGLTLLDATGQRVRHLRHDVSATVSLPNNDVRALWADADQVWIGTKNGLALADRAGRIVEVFQHRPNDASSLPHNYVRSLLRDDRGQLWVGTYGGGLSRFDEEAGVFSVYPPANQLSDPRVYTLHQSGADSLLVGTHGGGLNHVDLVTGRVTHDRHASGDSDSLASDRILSLATTADGTLWVGTSDGLCRQLRQATYSCLDTGNGLPNNVIAGLEVDLHDRLWISTNVGLARIDPGTGSVEAFPLDDVMQNTQFNGDASLLRSGGTLLFGGTQGAVEVDPAPPAAAALPITTVLTDLYLFNEVALPQRLDPDSPLVAPINAIEELTLNHRQNLFAVHFAALDAPVPNRIRFAYQLEGLSDRWIVTSANDRVATFTNLDAGHYVFRVHARAPDGRQLGESATLAIVMLPPPWATSAAFFVYTLTASVVLGWLALARHRRLREKHRAQAQIHASEERLSLALWGSGDELWDWDIPKRHMVRLNPLRQLQDHGAEDDFELRDFARFLHDDDAPVQQQALTRHLHGQTDYYECAYRIRDAAGEFLWVLDRGKVVSRDAEGIAQRMSGTLRIIHQLKESEQALIELNEQLDVRVKERTAELEAAIEELKRAQAELVESKKMASLGQLIAGVAHEINTPLSVGITAITTLVSKSRSLRRALEKEGLPDDVATYVAAVEKVTDLASENLMRASQLVTSFRQVAVDQSAETIREFNLRSYLEEILGSLEPKLRLHQATATLQCAEDLQLISRPGAIHQIIVNLIMNSIIHGFEHQDRGRITITAQCAQDIVTIRFADNGCGLSADAEDNLFEPFFTTKRGRGASGLGMHIVYNLVTQSLRGRIDYASSHKGLTVTIALPRVHQIQMVR